MVTIVVSDIHLGSPVCQAQRLLDFLQNLPTNTKRVIINGDLFDSIDITRLCKTQWKILSEFRKMSDRIELIWIIGNHDIGAEFVANMIGATTADQYAMEEESILFLHGHVFDKFILTYPKITWIADIIYFALQKISMKLARFVKYQSKTFLRCSDLVAQRALEYSGKLGYRYVCCGHTHHPVKLPFYCNSGSWTDAVCNYIEIKEGRIQLKEL